jgi:trans-aconitate methyltransferase
MTRVLEQEFMLGEAQVAQYTKACEQQTMYGGLALYATTQLGVDDAVKSVVDLGCGPCVYHWSLYTAFPNAIISAYDASPQMIDKASDYINPNKTILYQEEILNIVESNAKFDFVFSSLVLHHLTDPLQLWSVIKKLGRTGARFAVFDLLRLEGKDADDAVDKFTTAGRFNETFRQDFKNSLRAAFSLEEISNQIAVKGIVANVQSLRITKDISAVYISGVLN